MQFRRFATWPCVVKRGCTVVESAVHVYTGLVVGVTRRSSEVGGRNLGEEGKKDQVEHPVVDCS